MNHEALKVGELAARTGLSVRALHHYHEIGLLRPSRRTTSGHRLYSRADVARLLRIRALQQLGLSLEQIRACLAHGEMLPVAVLDDQIARVRAQTEQASRLLERLVHLREQVAAAVEVPLGEFLDTLEAMTMFEKYYTKGQLLQLDARRQQLGDDQIRAVEAEWPQLIAAVRAAMGAGTPPTHPDVRKLAARWKELVLMFTGADPGITASLRRMTANEPRAREHSGLDAAIIEYVGKASGG